MPLAAIFTQYCMRLAPDLDSVKEFHEYMEAYKGIWNPRVVQAGIYHFLYFEAYGAGFDPRAAEEYINAYYQRPTK